MRQDIIDLETACKTQAEAESLIGSNEYTVGSTAVLALAQSSGCTAYDCEFVSLAKALDVKLVTEDKKLRKAFPDIAVTALQYTASLP
jgi:predicted nucleic acid-binding protein